MMGSEIQAAVRTHILRFFAGHECVEHQWKDGPAASELPELRVAEFAPGPRTGFWVYTTLGASGTSDRRLEFILIAPERDERQVELLTMAAWHHSRERLGLGHTVPIGRPWLPGSTCEHFLVSLPYPFGPDLESCRMRDCTVHVLWLLPITAAERAFKVREGPDALEQLFDEKQLEYWVADRVSVVG
jgi:hypothetical protein